MTAHRHTNSDHERIARITATHCCVCSARLTDAESVERGMGPVCGGKYYAPGHDPSESMVNQALGLLAFSNLPSHIIEGFIKLVNNDFHNARLASNLLVYWASGHYGDKEEVFKCSRIIRALGYTKLADKLETDRTMAHIQTEADYLVAFVPDNFRFRRDMEQIPGIEVFRDQEMRQAKRKSKVGWTVPHKEKEHLLTILGVHYGGDLMSGDGKVSDIPRKRLSDLLAIRNKGGDGSAQSTIRFRDLGGSMEIGTLYSERFRKVMSGLPRADRRWNNGKRCWVFNAKHQGTVLRAVKDIFGVDLRGAA